MTIAILSERDGIISDIPNFGSGNKQLKKKRKSQRSKTSSEVRIRVPCDHSCACHNAAQGSETVLLQVCSKMFSLPLRNEISKHKRTIGTRSSIISHDPFNTSSNTEKELIEIKSRYEDLSKQNDETLQNMLKITEERDFYKKKMDEMEKTMRRMHSILNEWELMDANFCNSKENKRRGNSFLNYILDLDNRKADFDCVNLLGSMFKAISRNKESHKDENEDIFHSCLTTQRNDVLKFMPEEEENTPDDSQNDIDVTSVELESINLDKDFKNGEEENEVTVAQIDKLRSKNMSHFKPFKCSYYSHSCGPSYNWRIYNSDEIAPDINFGGEEKEKADTNTDEELKQQRLRLAGTNLDKCKELLSILQPACKRRLSIP